MRVTDSDGSRYHAHVVNVSMISARDENPAAAHERSQHSDEGQCSREATRGTELAMCDVTDEDEEESRTGREGDHELEQVALREPVSDRPVRETLHNVNLGQSVDHVFERGTYADTEGNHS